MSGVQSKVNRGVDTNMSLSKLDGRVSKIESGIVGLTRTDSEHANHYLALYDLVKDIKGEISSLKTRLGLYSGSIDNLVTLNSDVLPPELNYLQQSLHIPDAKRIMKVKYHFWGKQYSHFHQFADLLGVGAIGVDHVKNFRQLPPVGPVKHKRFPINIEFNSKMARDMAVQSLTRLGKESGEIFPIHFCVNNFPLLKHNLRAVTAILKQLQQEGEINWFATNNLMAIDGMEKVAPMYVFRTPGMKEATCYRECATNDLFHSGVFIPVEDKSFESNEFNKLMQAIRKHVQNSKILHQHSDSTIPVTPEVAQSNTTFQSMEEESTIARSYVDAVKTPAKATQPQVNTSNSDKINSQGKRMASRSPRSYKPECKKVKESEKSSHFGEIAGNITPYNSQKRGSICPKNLVISKFQPSTSHEAMQQPPQLQIGAIMADLSLSNPPKFQHIFTSQHNLGPFLPQNQYIHAYTVIGPPILNHTTAPMMSVPPPSVVYNSLLHQTQDKQNYQSEQIITDPFANMFIEYYDRK